MKSSNFMTGLCAGFLICFCANKGSDIINPSVTYKTNYSRIQEGYVGHSTGKVELEIRLDDIDNNMEGKTVIKINKKPYLLKEINGNAQLFPYDIKLSTK